MKYLFSICCLVSLISLHTACESNTQAEDPAQEEGMVEQDSLSNESYMEEEGEMDVTEAVSPDLIGKWMLLEIRTDAQPLNMESDEATIEFLTDGTLEMNSKGINPASANFSQVGDLLMSEMWDEAQQIQSLSQTELVLVGKVDGEDVFYRYKRLP